MTPDSDALAACVSELFMSLLVYMFIVPLFWRYVSIRSLGEFIKSSMALFCPVQ